MFTTEKVETWADGDFTELMRKVAETVDIKKEKKVKFNFENNSDNSQRRESESVATPRSIYSTKSPINKVEFNPFETPKKE